MIPSHNLGLILAGRIISKYLRKLPREKAMEKISAGYSTTALESLYYTAMRQGDYEVCSIVREVLERSAK